MNHSVRPALTIACLSILAVGSGCDRQPGTTTNTGSPQSSAASAGARPSDPATGAPTSKGPTTSPSAGATATMSLTAGGPAPTNVRVVKISISGRKVSPPPARIELRSGELIRLQITSDHDDELHIHGFEVERELFADRPTLVELRGGPRGIYDVETHNPVLRLTQLVVR